MGRFTCCKDCTVIFDWMTACQVTRATCVRPSWSQHWEVMKFIPYSLWPKKKGGSSQPMSSQFFFFFPFHFLLLVRLKWQHWEHFLVGFPGADTHQPRKLFCWEGSACKTKQDAHAYALGPASAHIRWQSTHSPGVGMSRLTAAVTCSASVPSVSSLHKHTSIGEHTHTHTHTGVPAHRHLTWLCSYRVTV